MGAEHQLIDGKDNSDPPYQGELRSSRRVSLKFSPPLACKASSSHPAWRAMHLDHLAVDSRRCRQGV